MSRARQRKGQGAFGIREQYLRRSLAYHHTILHMDDMVCVEHGFNPMGDD